MSVERQIGNETYRVDKMPPREAQRLFLRLSKVIGPAISMLGDVFSMEDEEERDRRSLMLIGQFLQTLDIDEAEKLLVDICQGAQIREDGQYVEIIFDVHFTDLFEAWKVGFFVLEAQFKGFFDAVSKSAVGQRVAEKTTSPSPKKK